MAEEPETPIVVNPSPVLAQVNTALRDVALVAAAIPALTALFGKRDILGLINWSVSSEAAPAISIMVTAGIFVWRQVHTRKQRADKVKLADAAPDSIGIVVGGKA